MILSLIIAFAVAQPDIQLRGHVVDPVRAAIAGARITAVPDDGSAAASTVTDAAGEFTLALAPGRRYTLTVASDGFLDVTTTLAAAEVGAETREFMLRVAGVKETVDVSAP